ncbi:MAG: HlyD family type I secretion periplasmic adaptor subunit [Hyphomicrobiaceae bacterium]
MAARDDLDFANDVRQALEQRAPRGAWMALLTIAAMMAAALAWASWAELEEVTSGQGRVIPSRQTQVVQTLEGGIAREILVREGDLVDAGQVLMRIDDTGFASRLGEIRQKGWALEAEKSRLLAEANGLEKIAFPGSLTVAARAAVDAQRESFRARRLQLDSEIGVLRQQLRQREQAVVELEASRAKLRATLKPLRREVTLTTRLKRSGAVPEIDLLRLQREAAALEGELAVVKASLPRATSAIDEVRRRIGNARAIFAAGARERLTQVRTELAVIDETVKAANDRVLRTALKAPVRGVINKLNVTTLGAVVQPGRDLIEIVPLDDALRIETRIRPRDVAFIHPDQNASVKLTAYDFLIYGALQGRVERISADTIADEKGDAFYRVIVKTTKNHLDVNGKKLPIIPGMVASVDIQTGEKTVLDYLLKPVLRARHEAMRER